MAKVTLTLCDKPKLFKDVAFLREEYEAAEKVGDVVVPMRSAMEAIKNSKGMYRIKQKESDVEVALQQFSLEDKDTEELKVMALAAGINLLGGPKGQRKRVSRESLIKAIKTKLSQVDIVDDGEDEDGLDDEDKTE